MHRYTARVRWEGSTAEGYEHYDRTHRVDSPPAHPVLELSADPAFRGDPGRLDPEELLVMAASSCQLLSFLAVCARARVDIVAYTDEAEAVMPADDLPLRITRIDLRPRIVVRRHGSRDGLSVPEQDERLRLKLERLVQVAHRDCYVANSLRTHIEVAPEIVVTV